MSAPSISKLLIYWDFPTQPSVRFSLENIQWVMGEKNMLMMPDIRGELVKLLQAYRKLKVMQITTHRRASLIAQHEDHHGRMEWSLLITGQVVGGLMDIQQTKPPCHNIQIISDCVFLITEWVLLKCLPQQLWYKMLQN